MSEYEPAQDPRLRERGAADGVLAQVLLHGVQLRGQVLAARAVPLQVRRLLAHPHQLDLCQLWSVQREYGCSQARVMKIPSKTTISRANGMSNHIASTTAPQH